jgi:hypothetical protein
LLIFCRIEDGIYVFIRLAMGNPGQDGDFDAPIRSRWPAISDA